MKHKSYIFAILATLSLSGCSTEEIYWECISVEGASYLAGFDDGKIVTKVACPNGCVRGICLDKDSLECIDDSACEVDEICVEGKCKQVECKTDNDCSDNYICVSNQCEFAGCKSDLDCIDEGYVCLDGYCVYEEIDYCTSDEFCGPGFVCVQGVCEPKTECNCPNGTICIDGLCVEDPHCNVDEDCDYGYLCIDGVCVEDPRCYMDDDCGDGYICIDGLCVEDPRCSVDDDCGDGYICIDGTCEIDPYCYKDEDCAEGMICILATGVCKEQYVYCNNDEDCVEGEYCIDGMCYDPFCHKDADCENGYYCLLEDGKTYGTCTYKIVYPTYCATEADCKINEFCFAGKCQSQYCELGLDDTCFEGFRCSYSRTDGFNYCEPELLYDCRIDSDCSDGLLCKDGICLPEDECPDDEAKTSAGSCGCGVADVDTNGNGVLDCLEASGSCVSGKIAITINKTNYCATPIANASELAAFRDAWNSGNKPAKASDRVWALVGDIDLGELGGSSWEPIKRFNGVFYGGNHTIQNTESGTDKTIQMDGLFYSTESSLIDSVQFNLNVRGASIVTAKDDGSSTFSNLKLSGSVTGMAKCAPVVGYNHDVGRGIIMDHIENHVSISCGSSYVGGFAGYIYAPLTLRDSYYDGSIKTCGTFTGGVTGTFESNDLLIERTYIKTSLPCSGANNALGLGAITLSRVFAEYASYRFRDFYVMGDLSASYASSPITSMIHVLQRDGSIPQIPVMVEMKNVFAAVNVTPYHNTQTLEATGLVGDILITRGTKESSIILNNIYTTGNINTSAQDVFFKALETNGEVTYSNMYYYKDGPSSNNVVAEAYSFVDMVPVLTTGEEIIHLLNENVKTDPSLAGYSSWDYVYYNLLTGQTVKIPSLLLNNKN